MASTTICNTHTSLSASFGDHERKFLANFDQKTAIEAIHVHTYKEISKLYETHTHQDNIKISKLHRGLTYRQSYIKKSRSPKTHAHTHQDNRRFGPKYLKTSENSYTNTPGLPQTQTNIHSDYRRLIHDHTFQSPQEECPGTKNFHSLRHQRDAV